MEWFTEFYWDWKWVIAAIWWTGVGYFIAHMRQKEKYERLLRASLKLHDAIKSAISKPVYLEDMGTNYDERG